ncbi:MAG: hypothetical protein NZM43_07240 [Saprospiraceae bacterium]|nr:hypothetical protein [Saprospiraceae bacterium]MDW8484102.1 hypothetical protein [Saprospiraceae bacterium]
MYTRFQTHALMLLTALCLYWKAAEAQQFPEHPEEEARNTGRAILLNVKGGAHLPGGDLSKRFGAFGSVGGSAEWLGANNFLFGLEAHYYFAAPSKEDPLAILRTPEGDLIGRDQFLADVDLRGRGHYLGGAIGYLFAKAGTRSGLRLVLGAGVVRHKIRIQDDDRTLVQVQGEYAKGYDRLTGGLAFNQFIGWQHLAPNRRANWFAGLEFTQAFTHTLREWDFTSMRKLEGRRTDLWFGLRLGWTLPLYQTPAEKIYY